MNNSVAASDALFCPVCHNPYSNPHSLPCGHTLCLHPCLTATKSDGGKLVCQMCNSSCEFCELTSDRKVSEKVASFKRSHQTLRDATCKGCRIVYSECRLCNHCNDYLCETCSRAHSEIYSSILLSRLISLRMRYRRLLSYAENDEYRQDPELMESINRYKATIESALSRAEVCVESLDAVLAENMENVFPDSSTNALKQQGSGDLWSVRQVDEVVSSGGQVVMEFPPSFRLPSDSETMENSSMRPLTPKEVSGTEQSWSHIHTAMSFELSRNKSKYPRPSNDAILRHFRQFGNVVQFHCNSAAHGYLDYSSHQETVNALKNPIYQIDGWLLKPRAIKEYPKSLVELAETFTVLFFQSWINTSRKNPPTSEDVEKHLSRFGTIVHFLYLPNPPRGYVEYKHHSEARNALSEPIHELGTWVLRMHPIREFPATHPLNSQISENMQNVSPDSSTNASEDNGCVSSAPRVDEVISSGGEAVMKHPPSFRLPSFDETAQNMSMDQLPQKVSSVPEKSWSHIHRAIFFELSRKKSENPRPSNDAILRHFRQFGNVVQFQFSSSASGYLDYSNHQEALLSLSEPSQQIDGWLLKRRAIEKYPQDLTDLTETFTVLLFQLSANASKSMSPSDEDLKRHLSRFGNIVHFQLLSNPSRGYVEYVSHSEARKALSEPTHEVGNRNLYLHPVKEFPAFTN